MLCFAHREHHALQYLQQKHFTKLASAQLLGSARLVFCSDVDHYARLGRQSDGGALSFGRVDSDSSRPNIFIVLFQGSMLGPECAAIFAIFTAQVWNMALSFYQSLRTVPSEMKEAGEIFQLSGWQIFWRIEVPFAMPALLWNAI